MPQALKAIYHSGTFILKTACNFPEGIEVELLVTSPQVLPPNISDIAARQDFLRLLVKRMQENPVPSNAPQFTRDMLHERR
ncbi:MAG: antitoxin family protein [Oscillatoria sp. SIO1A7]|nr:antitoxin family protein [Oscillatoria sp. SIO1A7]